MKFTDRGIKALKATGKRYDISETNGHGLRVRVGRTGVKTFVYLYRQHGKLRRVIRGGVPLYVAGTGPQAAQYRPVRPPRR